MVLKVLMVTSALLTATPALADELRDLCADRPGLGTPACTLDKGHVMVEVGIADWTRDVQPSSRTDSLIAGDTLVKIGLTDSLEAHVGWTAFGAVWEKDRASGASASVSRVGDVTVALRQNLHSPDGSGFSIAVMPYATLPAGREPVGAGDWGAGVVVPMSLDLGGVSLALTPEIDAAVDGDGKGRHLGYGTVAGLGFSLSESLSLTNEISVYRDADPDGHSTQLLAGLSLAWQTGNKGQWDVGANLGLNHASPDVELYMGYARRF